MSFNIYMTGSVNSSVNNVMKSNGLNVGVIVPPDKHYKAVLYSESEANRQFNEMTQDIYSKQKTTSFEETKKTPKLIKWSTITATLAATGYFIFTRVKK